MSIHQSRYWALIAATFIFQLAGDAFAQGGYTEEREICGATMNTPELHNVTDDMTGRGCHRLGDGRWCFQATDLAVTTPNSRWVFAGSPRVECARDNQGSCGWNALGAPDRFSVTLKNPTEIRARVLTNSRSIGVRICALARYYPGAPASAKPVEKRGDASSSNSPSLSAQAGQGKCTCSGAPTFTQEVTCKTPDGKDFKKSQTCWRKKNDVTGADCQTVCESAYNVCEGKPGYCQ